MEIAAVRVHYPTKDGTGYTRVMTLPEAEQARAHMLAGGGDPEDVVIKRDESFSVVSLVRRADEDVRTWLAEEIDAAEKAYRRAESTHEATVAETRERTLREVRSQLALLGLTARA
jgi:hypothetical protein